MNLFKSFLGLLSPLISVITHGAPTGTSLAIGVRRHSEVFARAVQNNISLFVLVACLSLGPLSPLSPLGALAGTGPQVNNYSTCAIHIRSGFYEYCPNSFWHLTVDTYVSAGASYTIDESPSGCGTLLIDDVAHGFTNNAPLNYLGVGGCAGSAPTNCWNIKCCMVNNDVVDNCYQLFLGSSPVGAPLAASLKPYVFLSPGQQGCVYAECQSTNVGFTVKVVDCSQAGSFTSGGVEYAYHGDGTGQDLMNPPLVTANQTTVGSSSGAGYTNPSTNSFGVAGNPSIYPGGLTGTNGPIKFTGTNSTETGFNALYDATTKGDRSIVDAITGVSNAIAGLDFSGAGSSVTSAVPNADWSTNVQAFPNYTGLTNGSTTGATDGMGDAITATEGAITSIGTPGELGSGSAAELSFEFYGTTFNLDPETIFPGLGEWLRAFWTVVLGLAFMRDVSKTYADNIKVFATAQTGGVPDMNATLAGFGGNAAGVACAIVVPVVFIALWAGVFTYFWSAVTAYLGLYDNGMTAIGGTSGTVIYLLTYCFPVNLAVGLLSTAIAVRLGAAKLVMISAAASRWLVGK